MSDKKVLYIDDELDLLEIAASFFQEEGLAIDTANSIAKATALMQQHRYDLVIADFRLGDGNGHDLIERMRKEGHFKGKFIAVTGELELKDTLIGGDFFLYKPIMFEELVQKIKAMLLAEFQ
jgi:two-component system, NtrC family, response regulator HydG